MDLREKKTKRSIANAFLKLRSQKALERITVKELAALAEISKATFYLHYKDIYDLSEQMQNEVIENILGNIAHPEYCISDSRAFTEELFDAFHADHSLIETLFSGSQNAVLPMRIEAKLRTFIRSQYPDMDKDAEMRLTYNIYGSYYVYQKYYKSTDMSEIIHVVCEAKI
ncbi:MAG: TetR/AcrR family transcriptional regulator [Clostridiales bacterium]|nr:TetR/AcrR family transcriptional regulator [Clostridiales bacterium]